MWHIVFATAVAYASPVNHAGGIVFSMYKLIITSLLAGILTPAAFALTPGTYEMVGGWGNLSIKKGTFSIFTVGANAHTCELEGTIKGKKGYPAEEGNEPIGQQKCVVDFKAVPGGFEVSSSTMDVCHQYCGMRASFGGTYLLPPSGCAASQRPASRKVFREKYDAKNYQQAYDSLNAFRTRCAKFITWMEDDGIRSDLAITQYHLGHKEACLNLLKDTRAAEAKNTHDLELPPADESEYEPIAKQIWFNLKKCGAPDKAKPE